MEKAIKLMTKKELIQKAAESRGLSIILPKDGKEFREIESEPVGIFGLQRDNLNTLTKFGFEVKSGNRLVYLCGNSKQNDPEWFLSDSWCWKDQLTCFEILIKLVFSINEKKRGVVVIPHVGGNWSGGAVHKPTINRLIKALASLFKKLPLAPALKEVAEQEDCELVIHWGEMGLGGLMSVGYLFREFLGYNNSNSDLISDLARTNISPFEPNPAIHDIYCENVFFVPEADQPELFKIWRRQLEEFKRKISI